MSDKGPGDYEFALLATYHVIRQASEVLWCLSIGGLESALKKLPALRQYTNDLEREINAAKKPAPEVVPP